MAVTLKYIGQAAMDEFLQNFKGNADFFELDDFIFRAGAFVSDYYQQMYQAKYGELRADKRAAIDLVGFNEDMLSVQTLEVKVDKDTGDHFSTLSAPVMTFMYDHSDTGYQMMIPVSPRSVNVERTAVNQLWQVQYLPYTNRVFWYPDQGKIIYIKKGACNINKVNLYYIPSVMDKGGQAMGEAFVPDGIVKMAITGTAGQMKQIAQGTIVKETNDLNPNKIMQTEINQSALKP